MVQHKIIFQTPISINDELDKNIIKLIGHKNIVELFIGTL
jgi:hypothetical protein